jgi:hypothetical protein
VISDVIVEEVLKYRNGNKHHGSKKDVDWFDCYFANHLQQDYF